MLSWRQPDFGPILIASSGRVALGRVAQHSVFVCVGRDYGLGARGNAAPNPAVPAAAAALLVPRLLLHRHARQPGLALLLEPGAFTPPAGTSRISRAPSPHYECAPETCVAMRRLTLALPGPTETRVWTVLCSCYGSSRSLPPLHVELLPRRVGVR